MLEPSTSLSLPLHLIPLDRLRGNHMHGPVLSCDNNAFGNISKRNCLSLIFRRSHSLQKYVHGDLFGYLFLPYGFACKQIMHREHSSLLMKTLRLWSMFSNFLRSLMRSAKASANPFTVSFLGGFPFLLQFPFLLTLLQLYIPVPVLTIPHSSVPQEPPTSS